jgi:hypothetical protein
LEEISGSGSVNSPINQAIDQKTSLAERKIGFCPIFSGLECRSEQGLCAAEYEKDL